MPSNGYQKKTFVVILINTVQFNWNRMQLVQTKRLGLRIEHYIVLTKSGERHWRYVVV